MKVLDTADGGSMRVFQVEEIVHVHFMSKGYKGKNKGMT